MRKLKVYLETSVFKHIVKWKTVSMTEVINLREGYRRIGIFSPTEIITNG